MTTVQIPGEEAFVVGTTAREEGVPGLPIFCDFIAAPELRQIGDRLVRDGPLTHLDDGKLRIDYRWKHKGGTSGGNWILGKCVKLSGPAEHYADGAQILIWLAADHCEYEAYDARQIEALVYHELLHISREERLDKFGNEVVVYRTRGHDFEGFFSELDQYGAWNRNWQRLVEVVRQLPLPMEVGV